MIRARSNWVVFAVVFVVTALSLVGVADALQGGPDKFGYRYIDSNEINGPKFEMLKFNTSEDNEGYTQLIGGKQISNLTLTRAYPIGFEFEFYGKKYNYFNISGNGYITFSYGDSIDSYVYEGQDVPSSKEPNCFIAPFWSHNDVHG